MNTDSARIIVVVTFFAFVLPSTPALALPVDGKVAAGGATITQANGQTLNISQLTDKAIINWKGFSINVNELVKFTQPGAGSTVLNRVTGIDPSSILGKLVANGRVFIVNPNGVFFGPNSVVDVAGLLATTLNIKDSDFMAGRFNFTQDPGKAASYVINQGQIKVSDNGFVFLVAPGVANDGLIVANLGKVVMGSGERFTVDFMGDGLISFAIEGKVLNRVTGPDGTPLKSAVSNSGTIKADGGQVILTAKASSDIFSSVVNQSGVIEARSLVNHGGVIRLEGSDSVANTGQIGWPANMDKVHNADGRVLNTGILDVSAAESGAAAGEVTLSGQMVGSSGTILARGAEGTQGGRVLLNSSEKTVLTTDSLIDTSGAGNSNAGNVVVWSDKDTIYRGSILAKGGEFGGDGGNVEVSGHENLNFYGFVDATAPRGTSGSLLLDPKNITVTNTLLPDVLLTNDQFSENASSNATFDADTITTITNLGTAVTLQANNDITINEAITTNNVLGAGGALTMQAGRSILINANITTDDAALTMTANETTANGVSDANRDSGAAVITMADGTTLNAGSANISITLSTGAGLTNSTSGNISLENLTTTGHVLVANNGATASSSIVRTSSDALVTASSAAFDVNGAGGSGSIGSSSAPIRVTVTNLEARGQSGGAFISSPSQGVNLGGATLGGLTGISISSGDLQVTANGAVTDSEAITGSTLTVKTLSDSGAAITLDTSTNDFTTVDLRARNAADSADAAGAVTYRDTSGFDVSTATTSSTVTLTGGGAITDSGTLSGTTLTVKTLSDSGAAITLNTATNDFTTVDFRARNAGDSAAAAGAITYVDTSGFDVAATTTSSTVTLTGGGAITDSGALTGSTLTVKTLSDSGATITLDTSTNDFTTVDLRARNAADSAAAAGAITYRDTSGFDVSTATTSSTVTLTGGGAITDSGTLTGSTLTVKTLSDSGAAITLDTSANDFTTVDLRARDAADSAAAAGALTYRDTSGFDVSTATTSSTVTLTGGGAITDSGALTGSTLTAKTLSDSGAAITLNTSTNDFTTVDLRARNAADSADAAGAITYVDTSGFDVAAATSTSTVTLTGGGAITDSGTLSSTTLTVKTLSDSGAAITLNTSTNDLTTVDLRARNAADSADAAGAITYRDTSGFDVAAATSSSTVTLTGGGAITDSGTLSGTTLTAKTLSDSGAAITLNTSTNDFTTVDLRARNAADSANASGAITYTDATGFDVAAVQTGSTLTLTSSGAITDSGALVVGGTTTTAAGSANDITLNTSTNDFATVGITSGNNVTLVDTNAIDLGASTASGSLNVTAGGAVTDSGTLTGSTLAVKTLSDSGAAITVDTSTNDFTTVDLRARNAADSAAAAGAITYRDTSGFDVAAATTSSTVMLTGGGAITDSGALTGTTLTVKTLSDSGATITLDTSTNDFTTVDLRARNAADSADAAGAITYRDTSGFDVAAATSSSTVTLTGGGAITDSGTLSGTTLTAKTLSDSGAAITLNTSTNDFTTVDLRARNAADSAAAAGALTYRDTSGFDVAAATTSSTVTLTGGGAITDSGTLTGTTLTVKTLSDSGGAITLDTSTNDFTTVDLRARNTADSAAAAGAITYRNTSGFDVAAATTSSTVTLTAGGAITDSGTLSGTTLTVKTLSDSGAAITLDTSTNEFTTVDLRTRNAADSSNASGAITYRDATGFDVAAAQTGSTLTLTSSGAITDSGALVVGGTTTIAAGTTNDITLNTSTNDFATAGITSGNNVTLVDTNAIDLGASTASGSWTVTAGGAVTDSGTLTGTTLTVKTLSDSGAAITLDTSTNDFTTVDLRARNAADSAAAAGAITYRNTSGFDVSTATTSSTVTLTGGGAITDSGTLSGTTLTVKTLSNSGAAITLNTTTNDFATVDLRARNAADSADAAGAITYVDATGFEVDTVSTSSTVTLTATAGAILDGNDPPAGTNNITATTLTVTAATSIGTSDNPVEVSVSGDVVTSGVTGSVSITNSDATSSTTDTSSTTSDTSEVIFPGLTISNNQVTGGSKFEDYLRATSDLNPELANEEGPFMEMLLTILDEISSMPRPNYQETDGSAQSEVETSGEFDTEE